MDVLLLYGGDVIIGRGPGGMLAVFSHDLIGISYRCAKERNKKDSLTRFFLPHECFPIGSLTASKKQCRQETKILKIKQKLDFDPPKENWGRVNTRRASRKASTANFKVGYLTDKSARNGGKKIKSKKKKNRNQDGSNS